MVLEAGDRLGIYEILSALGAGGMGEVYRAKDTKLGREVAIKVLPDDLAGDADRLVRFQREAQILASLNHPNIVTIHSVEEADGVHFLCMELIEGRSLDAIVPEGGLDLEALLEIALPLAEAVSAAHEKEVVHRDLKPANIMLNDSGRVKVLDFGLAKGFAGPEGSGPNAPTRTRALTREGSIIGTMPYMAPEQLQGEAADRRSDVFSLGAVLYEMATGRRPFDGRSSAELISSILRDAPTAVSKTRRDLPPRLGRIIGRCLEKQPDDRFSSAGDLHYELRALRRELSLEADAVDSPPRKRGTLGVVLAAAALAGLAWGAWVLFAPIEPVVEALSLTISPLTDSAGLSLSGSWSPDGSQLAFDYTANGTMDIAVMSLGGGEPRMIVGGPHDESKPRWSPDGSKIAFLADPGTGQDIYWVPPTGGAQRKIASTGFQYLDRFGALRALGAQPWSPDGSALVFSRLHDDGSAALWRIEVASGEESSLTTPPAGVSDFQAAWSPDGAQIAFHREDAGSAQLFVMSADGGEPKELLPGGYPNAAPSWTTDGSRIVFISSRGAGWDLYDVDLETETERQLTTGAIARTPIVSSTGRIVYSRWTHETYSYRLRVGSSEEHEQLSPSKGDNFGQRFSPDGRRMLLQSARTGRSQIWLLDLDTGSERSLTQPPAGKEDRTPDWSPDGSQVVFLSNREGPFQLWKMDSDGGNLRRLSDQPIPMDGDWWVNARVAPRWSADGRSIAYLAPGEGGSALWLIGPDGDNQRQSGISGVLRFDWYLGSGRVIYTRKMADGSGRIEMVAAHLESGAEEVLLKENATELSVSWDGRTVAYNSADGHFSANRYLLPLVAPASAGGLPRVAGDPAQITFGEGLWHVHGGAWTPDDEYIVYTRDFDSGDLFVIDGYE